MKKGQEEFVYSAVKSGDMEVDEMGRIWRVKKRGWARWLKKAVTRPCERVRAEHNAGQYLMVRAMLNGERHFTQASRIVYRHFFGPIQKGKTINHKNGIKKDNRPENLETATYSENQIHAVRVLHVGTTADQNGEKNPMAKLTNDGVKEIRNMKTEIELEMKTRHGRKISMLAKKYGVSYQTVWDVLRGRHWTI